MNVVFGLIFLLVTLPAVYLGMLALAAIPNRRVAPSAQPRHRFAIAIPAHNEESVIGQTVSMIKKMDYAPDLFDVLVVADHCSDQTVEIAREAGALAYERQEEPRGSKGAALRWLFQRTLEGSSYDAVIIFDADTHVAPDFLRIMDARLAQGDQVIQGQHRIRNPEDGWFPALTWAMFLVDNRLQNQSRSNLGWSAKNMGDSICLRADVLRQLGWGEGLTEDYAFRHRLMLEGIRIRYEPSAVGLGEAPLTWKTARVQRARWLRGTTDASQHYARQLWREGLRRCDLALLDGALQARLPSYSTLTLIALVFGMLQGLGWLFSYASAPIGWLGLLCLLTAYPLWGLALERAPFKAYLVMLSGPVFILWRTWLAATSRFGRRQVKWVRTPRKAQQG